MSRFTRQSADFRMFCQLLRGDQNELDILRRELANASWDWNRFLEGARRHRVEQPLFTSLKAVEPLQVPDFVLTTLRADARVAARNSLMQMREIARLAQHFSRASIPLMALKGVSLSAQLDRDPGLRNSRDIDLLIAPDQRASADGLMREAGYRAADLPTPELAANGYYWWGKESKYVHPENRTLVELHYRLSDNTALLDFDFHDLWREHETVEVGGVPIAVMSRGHLPLYLCIHGAVHGWERLCWLIDLSAALAFPGAVKGALDSAAEKGLIAPMLQAILLAHDWLGLPVGEDVLAYAKSCARVRRLNGILYHFYGPSAWYRSPSRDSVAGFVRYSAWLRLYVYSLKPGWQYRKRQIAREFVAPADWTAFRLPRQLSWLYPVIRPFGWLVRRLMRLV